MRKGLFISALFAAMAFGGVALANQDNDSDKPQRGREIKERVLEKSRETRAKSERSNDGLNPSERARMAKMLDARNRAKGDMVDQYERSYAKNGGVDVSSRANKASRNPITDKLRQKGEMVDGGHRNASKADKEKKSSRGNHAEPAWTPAGKSTSTMGTYFKNDKGQVQNNIRGATATAKKIRGHAKVLLSGSRNSKIKAFDWTTTGGDGQSMNPGH